MIDFNHDLNSEYFALIDILEYRISLQLLRILQKDKLQ